VKQKRGGKVVDAKVIDERHALVPSAGEYSLELAISMWLHAKAAKSKSARTPATYETTLGAFRRYLSGLGLDLDARPASPDDPHPITTAAQAWATQPRQDGRTVSSSTVAQRLAILSSFYAFALRRRILRGENPISSIERPTVQRYAGARPLERTTVVARLAAINRATPAGARDYALLGVALETGRRLSELAALDWRDVTLMDRGSRATLTWRRVKGGKVMHDTLSAAATGALLTWLSVAYGAELDAELGQGLATLAPDKPLWISLSRNGTAGRRLSRQSVAAICERRVGTSKVHALRHTFAVEMERAGASLTDIQARLGHANAATTGIYLNALKAADNPYAEQLAAAFGIGTPAKELPRSQPGRGPRVTRPLAHRPAVSQ